MPLPWPVTMIVSPKRIGVVELLVDRVTHGRCQSSAPVATSTPTTFFCVIVTSCRVPPSSVMIGDA